MTEEQMPHGLTLKSRKSLSISGVSEVLSVEEDGVALKTSLGILVIHGQGLKIRTLCPEGGRIEMDGTVTALIYEEPRRGGFLSRLFG